MNEFNTNNGVQALPFEVTTTTTADGSRYAEATLNGMNFFLSIDRAELSIDDQYISSVRIGKEGGRDIFVLFVESGHYTTIMAEDVAMIRKYIPDNLREILSFSISKVL